MERSIDDKMKMIQELRENTGSLKSRDENQGKMRNDHFFRKMCSGLMIRFSIAGLIFILFFVFRDKNFPILQEFNQVFYLNEEEISGYRLIDFTKIIHYNNGVKEIETEMSDE